MGRRMRHSHIQKSAKADCRLPAEAYNDCFVSVNKSGSRVEEQEEEGKANLFKPSEPHHNGGSICNSPHFPREPTLPALFPAPTIEENCSENNERASHHQQQQDDELLLSNLESRRLPQPYSERGNVTQNAVAEWVIEGVNTQRLPAACMDDDDDDDDDEEEDNDNGNENDNDNNAIGPGNYLIRVHAEVVEEVEGIPMDLDDGSKAEDHQDRGAASCKDGAIIGMSRKWIIAFAAVVVVLIIVVVISVVISRSIKPSPPTDVTMAPLEAFRSLLLSHSISSRQDLYETASPQYQSVFWLANQDDALLNASSTPWQTIMERYIMASFYFATRGESWRDGGDPTNFLSNQSICSWHDSSNTSGVSCNNQQSIVALVLDDKGLQGSILTELGKLSNLEFLALDHNRLSGTIPTQLAELTNLTTLDLSSNSLIASNLITGLGQLSNLQELALNNNHLSGTLPTELARVTKLTSLDISYNRDVQGTIITELAQLSSLRYVAISNTQLSGTLPTEMARLSNLASLLISFNPQLAGTILTEFGVLSSLQNLALDHNQLTGTIPTELGRLTLLTSLVIYGNRLTGTVPTILAALPNLKYLSLGSNSLRGNLTPFFCNRDISWEYFGADCKSNVECRCCTTC